MFDLHSSIFSEGSTSCKEEGVQGTLLLLVDTECVSPGRQDRATLRNTQQCELQELPYNCNMLALCYLFTTVVFCMSAAHLNKPSRPRGLANSQVRTVLRHESG